MKIKRVVAIGAAVSVALSGLALSSASAEPVSNSYVLVGSDTLQDSSNALINGTSITGPFVRVLSNNKTLASYDAFGSIAIQTKPGGPFFGRPSGSGAGVTALRASILGTTTYSGNAGVAAKTISGQVDIARSSSGPSTNANELGKLLYVPFARDAVAYAYKGGTAAWANLTTAQLKSIYDGTLTSIDGVAVTPRLPQTGSGTRNFFLNTIGYPGSAPVAPAVSDVGNVTPENDANVLAAGQIIPFSVASWVAQANLAAPVNTTTAAGVLLGSAVAGQAPYTGTGNALVPNADYYSSSYGRDTYLVVEYARVDSSDPKFDQGLKDLIDPTKAKSLTHFPTGTILSNSSGAVKKKFGFLPPSTTNTQRAFLNL